MRFQKKEVIHTNGVFCEIWNRDDFFNITIWLSDTILRSCEILTRNVSFRWKIQSRLINEMIFGKKNNRSESVIIKARKKVTSATDTYSLYCYLRIYDIADRLTRFFVSPLFVATSNLLRLLKIVVKKQHYTHARTH